MMLSLYFLFTVYNERGWEIEPLTYHPTDTTQWGPLSLSTLPLEGAVRYLRRKSDQWFESIKHFPIYVNG